ncbi:MAG TPA: radical SAM protein [Acidobacteriota bacterium]|nr:radical SAM protein [Acidobacteriota bacterium]
MNKFEAQVDEHGRLVFPEEFGLQYGLKPGAMVHVDETAKGPRLRLPVTHLKKVYIEPTNRCNLDCRTCMRNSWDEPLGQMSRETFARIIDGLRSISPSPTVFMGALGEPLAHPDILDMVAQAKELGSSVEMITNGTLLKKDLSKKLIDAGLDKLWVSLDGATPECYGDVRLGALLPEVLENLRVFGRLRWLNPTPISASAYDIRPEIGIVFVAMKRNIHELPQLLNLATELGATRLLVSNILPYTEEMSKEILYTRSLSDMAYRSSILRLDLPKLDIDEDTKRSLYESMQTRHSLSLVRSHLWEGNDYCPFIENGAMAVNWEGSISPCIPLLHSHKSYFEGTERNHRRYAVGNVNDRSVGDLWRDPEYLGFRERVQRFEFAPCTYCEGCTYLWENERDCLGNRFPTCGACLWAQGIIQCP